MIILISGYPLSGKTTLAKRLLDNLHQYHPVYINTDELRIRLNLGKEEKEASGKYLSHATLSKKINLVYKEIEKQIKEILLLNNDEIIIIDGTYKEKEKRNNIINLAKISSSKIVLIKVICENEEVIKSLAKSRSFERESKSFAGIDVYREVKKIYESPEVDEKNCYDRYFEVTNPLEINDYINNITLEIKSLL